MDSKDKIINYSQFLNGDKKEKFQSRLEELIDINPDSLSDSLTLNIGDIRDY